MSPHLSLVSDPHHRLGLQRTDDAWREDALKGGMTPERAFALGRAAAWLAPHALLETAPDRVGRLRHQVASRWKQQQPCGTSATDFNPRFLRPSKPGETGVLAFMPLVLSAGA